MFGVLVVKNTDSDLGYLASFSGKLADESLPNKFVPPIFNMITEGSFYEQGEKEIEKIGEKIQQLKKDKNYLLNKKLLKKHTEYVKEDLAIQRKKMRTSKHLRKHQKEEASLRLDDKSFEVFTKKLIQESFNDQFFYRELQEYYENKIKKIKNSLLLFENNIEEHIRNRKKISKTIQNTLFEKYQFLNQQKEQKWLLDIFDNASVRPPAGCLLYTSPSPRD